MTGERTLEFVDHQSDPGEGNVPEKLTVTLADGKLVANSPVASAIADGQRRRLAYYLDREPTDTELFDHLTMWSNGYVGGREVTSAT
jgi:hypothetical protein